MQKGTVNQKYQNLFYNTFFMSWCPSFLMLSLNTSHYSKKRNKCQGKTQPLCIASALGELMVAKGVRRNKMHFCVGLTYIKIM